MPSDIVHKILERINRPELFAILTRELSGSELNSILLEVFNQRSGSLTAPELLNLYQQNRFVNPSDLPVIELRQMELDILQLFTKYSFEPLELSPVSILGSCSAVAPANQNKILSALRGTEVLADSTNAIALHASDLRQNHPDQNAPGAWMRFCNIQRQLRTQTISGKWFRPHFKIGCLVTCGADTGGLEFEKKSLYEHMQVMNSLFLDYYKVEDVSFQLLCREGYPEPQAFARQIGDFLLLQKPDIRFTILDKPEHQTNYYKGLQYKVSITFKGKSYEIADGGFVDWTQQLLQNKKERMLSTGFGFDFMYRILTDR
jgi:hypothetical protein